tara:strand:+ start:3056 stop:3820 length:765 start_codon:yes stop_codon:yes gene_type:complete
VTDTPEFNDKHEQFAVERRALYVIQHTDAEYLGLIEDHLEGRSIGFTYMRPHTTGGHLPATVKFTDGVVLLGGGPWGSAGDRDLPTLEEEVQLVRNCMLRGAPVLGIGLGAQVLALASGGSVRPAPLRFKIGVARRTRDDALNGFLPETFPIATYMRDAFEAPPHADVLAIDEDGAPAVFQVAENCFGFAAHPGLKGAMIEDLIMEFDESPEGIGEELATFRQNQAAIEDALVPIMTGVVQKAGWMGEMPSGRL